MNDHHVLIKQKQEPITIIRTVQNISNSWSITDVMTSKQRQVLTEHGDVLCEFHYKSSCGMTVEFELIERLIPGA